MVGYPDASRALRPAGVDDLGRDSAPAWPHASLARAQKLGSAAPPPSATPAGMPVSTSARSTSDRGRRTSTPQPAYGNERTGKTGNPLAWQPIAAMGLDGIAGTRDTVAEHGCNAVLRERPGSCQTVARAFAFPATPGFYRILDGVSLAARHPPPHPGGDDGAHQQRPPLSFTGIPRSFTAANTKTW